MSKHRNPNRGVVLSMGDAAAIHRWLELVLDDRKFDNPIIAAETRRDAIHAKQVLAMKLASIYLAHRERVA